MAVEVFGVNLKVVETFEGVELPEGFEYGLTRYKGEEIQIAKDPKHGVDLFLLVDPSTMQTAFFLKSQEDVFTPYVQVPSAEQYVIVHNDNPSVVPAGYTETVKEVDGAPVQAWYATEEGEEAPSFLLYLADEEGKRGFYTYNPEEGTVELVQEVVETEPESTTAPETETVPETTKAPEKETTVAPTNPGERETETAPDRVTPVIEPTDGPDDGNLLDRALTFVKDGIGKIKDGIGKQQLILFAGVGVAVLALIAILAMLLSRRGKKKADAVEVATYARIKPDSEAVESDPHFNGIDEDDDDEYDDDEYDDDDDYFDDDPSIFEKPASVKQNESKAAETAGNPAEESKADSNEKQTPYRNRSEEVKAKLAEINERNAGLTEERTEKIRRGTSSPASLRRNTAVAEEPAAPKEKKSFFGRKKAVEAPKATEPVKAEAVKAEAPKAEAPKAQAPKAAEAVKAEAPKAEAQKAVKPAKAQAPKAAKPGKAEAAKASATVVEPLAAASARSSRPRRAAEDTTDLSEELNKIQQRMDEKENKNQKKFSRHPFEEESTARQTAGKPSKSKGRMAVPKADRDPDRVIDQANLDDFDMIDF